MSRPYAVATSIVPTIARLALLTLMLFSPIVAISYAGDQSLQIEAPVQKRVGAGFVILMTLQRH